MSWLPKVIFICSVLIIIYLTTWLQLILNAIWNLVILAFYLLLYTVVAVSTVCIAAAQHKKKLPPRLYVELETPELLLNKTEEKLQDYMNIPKKTAKTKPLISRNVDDAIDELITLLLRDYIDSWYKNLVLQQSLFCNELKPIIREMLFSFRNRCQKTDDVKFITYDVVIIVTKHLQQVKSAAINPPNKMQAYKVYPFLESKEMEMDYLRKITEFLLVTLLPVNYAKVQPVLHLLREVFACCVFYNLIDKLTDPDSINQRLIAYIKNQQIAAEKHSRTYAYAETYEDFIKMIQDCGNIDALQRMRYSIVTEIMQATTMSNLKRSKGIDADKELNTQKTTKGELLQSRNLSRYLNQLRFAKSQCEKRLKLLGGPDYLTSPRGSFDSTFEEKILVPGKKVLSMSVIMQFGFCRRYLSRFLQKEEMHSLLGFWEAVEDLKCADKMTWHQLANDIVRLYIHSPNSGVRLNKNTLKGIEEFMMANKGPEAFFKAQDEIYKQLEENCYASFIVSDIYHKMLSTALKEGIDFSQGSEAHSSEQTASSGKNIKTDDSDVSVFDHSSYARSQLKSIGIKLEDKSHALQALKSNPKCDRKMVMKLEREIVQLRTERNSLQNHIQKTELWIRYLGLWQATVMQAAVKKEHEKTIPYFNIMVHLSNEAGLPSPDSVGWVVSRPLNAFHSLHQKLVPAAIWLKKIDLPTKPIFKSLDKAYLAKAKGTLQTFLYAVTKDDGLNKSEALYNFLSPSPEHIKHPSYPQKKSFRFNLLQIFKGSHTSSSHMDEAEGDELLFLDDADGKEDKKDSIAEPLYTLIGEIFELKGVFNILRRTLIIFVQITYGRTINKQLRESVSWITSEPMLLSYLQSFRDTMWPTRQSVSDAVPSERTSAQKFETKYQARKILLSNIPEILNNLLGQQNAKRGTAKIFEALQDKILNKQLFYSILEAFIHEYSAELKKYRIQET